MTKQNLIIFSQFPKDVSLIENLQSTFYWIFSATLLIDCLSLAAHCFSEKYRRPEDVKSADDVVAWVGKHNLLVENERGSVAHIVNNIILHEDWKHNEDRYDADIALLLLKTEVDLTQRQFVRIVCLPTPSQSKVTGDGTVVGFGVSKRSIADREGHDSTPNELTLPAVTQAQCFAADYRFHLLLSNRTFCAGFVNQGKAVCRGDSGGGFYQFDYRNTSRYILAGIVSASVYDPMEFCKVDTYSVFTDVSKFVGWIQSKIKETKKIEWTFVKLLYKE
jgi:secreted trypsin-like serine protease